MSGHRSQREPTITRLLRLGILSQIDEPSGRWIAWDDEFRTAVEGAECGRRAAFFAELSSDDPATVQAQVAETAGKVRAKQEASEGAPIPPIDRPSAQELVASLSLGPANDFAHRQLAVLEFLREVGMVGAVEVDPVRAAIRVRLTDSYRRLIEADREPDGEPGFEAAWNEGGPRAVQAWLDDEARKLGPIPKRGQRRTRKGPRTSSIIRIADVEYRGLRDLIHEVYGADAQRFLGTPRRSLGGRTPAEALRDGDIDAVWEVAIAGNAGDWS